MRPLREWTRASHEPLRAPPPFEAVSILGISARSSALFEAGTVFDRHLFGLSRSEARGLGAVAPHLCEVLYEALESSGIALDRLASIPQVTFVGLGPPPWTGGEGAIVHDVFGLAAPAIHIPASPIAGLTALHLAAVALRAREADLALVIARTAEGGVGAAVLACPEVAASQDWFARTRLVASALSRRGAAPSAQVLAHLRAPETRPEQRIRGTDLMTVARICAAHRRGDIGAVDIGSVDADLAVHLLLAPSPPLGEGTSAPGALTLSARTDASLRALVRSVARGLDTDASLANMARESARRPAWEHRLAVGTGAGARAVQQRLSRWLTGDADAASHGVVQAPTGVAFVAPPAGIHQTGMADFLYGTEAVFRDAVHHCDAVLGSVLPQPLLTALFPTPDRPVPLDDPTFTNPLTVALSWSLAQLMYSRGVIPTVVLGCGVGELAAAAIAGRVSIDFALCLAAERGRLLKSIRSPSARVVVDAEVGQVRELLLGQTGVDLCAVPLPRRVLVGGRPDAVEAVAVRARSVGLPVRAIPGHPGHSPLVDPLLESFGRLAAELAGIPSGGATREIAPVWLSAATGAVVDGVGGADHWRATLRGPLLLATCLEVLHERGCAAFVELASRPMLSGAAEGVLAGHPITWLCPMGTEAGDGHLDEVLANLWIAGVPVSPSGLGAVIGAFGLSSYPWDRRTLLDETDETDEVEGSAVPRIQSTSSADLSGPLAWVPTAEGSGERIADTLVPEEFDGSSLDALDVPRVPASSNRQDPITGSGLSWRAPSPSRTPTPIPEEQSNLPDGMLLEGDFSVAGYVSPSEPVSPTAPVDPLADLIALEDLDVAAYGGEPIPLGEAEIRLDEQAIRCVAWDLVPVVEVATPRTRTWVLISDREGFGDYLATLLEAAGDTVIRVSADGTSGLAVPDPCAPGAFAEVVQALASHPGEVRIVHLLGLDTTVEASHGWVSALSLIQELSRCGARVPIHFVTRGSAHQPTVRTAVSGAAVWGLGCWLAVEAPGLFGGVVDLDPRDEAPDLLVQHLLVEDEPCQVAFHGSDRLKRRIVVPDPPALEGPPPSGTWVLAGDLDAPLAELTVWLSSVGVDRIVLVGRDLPAPVVIQQAMHLQQGGRDVRVVRADVTTELGRDLLAQRIGDAAVSGVVFRHACGPTSLVHLPGADAGRSWDGILETVEALDTFTRGTRPAMWIWSEGGALCPRTGWGLGSVVGASLGAFGQRRAAEDRPTTVIHAPDAGAMGAGQAVRLVGRLGPRGGVWGLWAD